MYLLLSIRSNLPSVGEVLQQTSMRKHRCTFYFLTVIIRKNMNDPMDMACEKLISILNLKSTSQCLLDLIMDLFVHRTRHRQLEQKNLSLLLISVAFEQTLKHKAINFYIQSFLRSRTLIVFVQFKNERLSAILLITYIRVRINMWRDDCIQIRRSIPTEKRRQ